MAALLMAVALLPGCATSSGWTRVEGGACDPKDPPIVCFEAEPDEPVELHVGQVVLLPGECARAPDDGKGGALRAEVRGLDTEVRRFVHTARGKTTFLVLRDDKLEVDARTRCDRTRPGV